MAPRLIPWAVVTIRLCAAWRNTSVNRTTGTAPEAMMSASTWPGPTEGSWSTSPTISIAASSGTTATSARISITSTMDVSSITSRPQSSGFSPSRRNPPVLGSTSSRRWIVFASNPVASLIRLAARPVGAHSRISTPLADRMRRIELTIVVLPTPGPPVITETFEESAARTASAWPGARASPVLPSTQGRALSGSIWGQGSLPAAIPRRRPAIARSARCRPPRNMQGVSSTVSATTVPSASSRPSAARISSPGTSRSLAASGPT